MFINWYILNTSYKPAPHFFSIYKIWGTNNKSSAIDMFHHWPSALWAARWQRGDSHSLHLLVVWMSWLISDLCIYTRQTELCLPDANVSQPVCGCSLSSPSLSVTLLLRVHELLRLQQWSSGQRPLSQCIVHQSREESEIMPMFGLYFGSVSTCKKVYSCMWLSLFMFHVCVHLQNAADCRLTLTKTQLTSLLASYRNGLSGHLRLPCWCK